MCEEVFLFGFERNYISNLIYHISKEDRTQKVNYVPIQAACAYVAHYMFFLCSVLLNDEVEYFCFKPYCTWSSLYVKSAVSNLLRNSPGHFQRVGWLQLWQSGRDSQCLSRLSPRTYLWYSPIPSKLFITYLEVNVWVFKMKLDIRLSKVKVMTQVILFITFSLACSCMQEGSSWKAW